ncbi:MAG: AAA family ATPase [Victivallales bacterium]|nr:AAA family ATPase [Victivallales bacterium]
MKIKKLTIENMNSLYGTWEIDFQNEAFLNNSLFAITGKTGSGKSTILDAISFALYDRTDRMGTKRSAFASRGTMECMAELVFEVDGIEYCSHTSLKAKSNGAQKGTFYDAPDTNACWLQWQKDGEIQKVEGTNAKGAMVKQILGLDFKQFCQVILLAQGKFNAFLAEDASKRADILEKITGTAVYTKIGGKIAERSKAAADKRQQTLDKIAAIKQLTEEELQQKEARLEEIVKEMEQITADIRKLEELLSIDAKRRECATQLNQKRKEETELAAEEEAFTKSIPKLEAARTAAKVTPSYLEYKPVEEAQERDRQSLENINASLPAKRQEKEKAQAANTKKEKALKDAETQKAVREAFLLEIDQLDATLNQLSSSCDEKSVSCQNLQNEIEERQKGLKALEEKLLQLSNDRKEAEEYLKAHEKDRELESKSSGWREVCTSIQKASKSLKKSKKELKAHLDGLNALRSEAAAAQVELDENLKKTKEAEAASAKAKEKLASLLGGRTLEELKADVNEQNKTVALLRALNPQKCLETFEEGAPCPVCGSTHHPYRLLQPEELPSLEKAEQQLKIFEKRHNDATEAAEAVNNAELALKMARHTLQTAIEKKQDLDKRIAQMQSDFDTKTKACQDEEQAFAESIATLKNDLAQYGFTWNGEASLPADVQTRKTTYSEKKSLIDDSEKEQAALQQEKARLEGEQKTQKAMLEKLQEELNSLQTNLQQQKAVRFEKYRDSKTADERKALETAVSTAREENDTAVRALVTAEENLRNAEENAQNLASAMTTRQPVLDSAWKTLQEMLLANGLTLVTYLAHILHKTSLMNSSPKKAALRNAVRLSRRRLQRWRLA